MRTTRSMKTDNEMRKSSGKGSCWHVRQERRRIRCREICSTVISASPNIHAITNSICVSAIVIVCSSFTHLDVNWQHPLRPTTGESDNPRDSSVTRFCLLEQPKFTSTSYVTYFSRGAVKTVTQTEASQVPLSIFAIKREE